MQWFRNGARDGRGIIYSARRAAPPMPPCVSAGGGPGGVPGLACLGWGAGAGGWGGAPAALLVAGLAGAALVPALPCGVTPADC